MAVLRRRTGALLWLVLASALIASVVGTGFVLWNEPHMVGAIAVAGCFAALVLCKIVDEFGWLLVGLAVIFSLLGNGLYALYLLGASFDTLATIAGGLAGVIVLLLGRALIAAGSADYPYID